MDGGMGGGSDWMSNVSQSADNPVMSDSGSALASSPGSSFAPLDASSLSGLSGLNNAASPAGGGGAGAPATPTSMGSTLAQGGTAAPTGMGPAAAATGGIPNPVDTSILHPTDFVPAGANPSPYAGMTTSLPSLPAPINNSNPVMSALGLNGGVPTRDLVAGGLLGGTMLNALLPNGQTKALKSLANQERSMANGLMPQVMGELNGQLPAGAEAALQLQSQAANAQTLSHDASLGIAGSSMEGQDMASNALQTAALRFQIAQELAQTGMSGLQAANSGAASLLQAILGDSTQRDDALGTALANFAGQMVAPRRVILNGTGG